jgi:hypothetical protein
MHLCQVLLPGHLLMRFTREKLEDCLAALKEGVARDAARAPDAVNLQVLPLRRVHQAGSCRLAAECQNACMPLWRDLKAQVPRNLRPPSGLSPPRHSRCAMPRHLLQDESYMRKLADRMPDIGRKMEYMLNTGNLVSKSGLDLSQSSGFTVVAEKLNFFR